MELHPPLIITPRLLPGARIADAFISIEPAGSENHQGKPFWRYFIDFDDGRTVSDSDLAGWKDAPEMLATLATFMSACGDAYRYKMARPESDPENLTLFPEEIREWLYLHNDDLALLAFEIENPESSLTREEAE